MYTFSHFKQAVTPLILKGEVSLKSASFSQLLISFFMHPKSIKPCLPFSPLPRIFFSAFLIFSFIPFMKSLSSYITAVFSGSGFAKDALSLKLSVVDRFCSFRYLV